MRFDYSNCFQDLLPFNIESKNILKDLRTEPDQKTNYGFTSEQILESQFTAVKAYCQIHKLYKTFKYIREINL